MDLNNLIKNVTVLNIDKQESTISPLQLVSNKEINNDSLIISRDDEELIINVQFEYFMDLKSMRIHSMFPKSQLPEHELSEISSPKTVHVYRANKLNINFEDIKTMKAHKSVICRAKKLKTKGQNINLYKQKQRVFEKTKYLSLYIESNQGDTDVTFLNALKFKGAINYNLSSIDLTSKHKKTESRLSFANLNSHRFSSVHPKIVLPKDLIPQENDSSKDVNVDQSDELISSDEIDTIWIQSCGSYECAGYYNAVGIKNGKYHFKQKRNPLAELFCDDKGFWYLMHGTKAMYESMQTSLTTDYPPCNNWKCIEGALPLPYLSQMMEKPVFSPQLALTKSQMKANQKRNLHNTHLSNEFDVAIDIKEFEFNGGEKVGFTLNVGKQNKDICVIQMKQDGQAQRLGVLQGDILFEIDGVEVYKNADLLKKTLKKCLAKKEKFSISFIRPNVEDLEILVNRAGHDGCNGKYLFFERNMEDSMCPIYKQINGGYALKRAHLSDDGQSLWIMQQEKEDECIDFYMALSSAFLPPLHGWQVIPDSCASYPAPGLQFKSLSKKKNKLNVIIAKN